MKGFPKDSSKKLPKQFRKALTKFLKDSQKIYKGIAEETSKEMCVEILTGFIEGILKKIFGGIAGCIPEDKIDKTIKRKLTK